MANMIKSSDRGEVLLVPCCHVYVYIYTHAFVCSMEGASLPTRDHHRYWPKVDLPHFSMISLHSHVYLLKMYTPIILHYIASSTYLIVFPWDPHENTTSSALGRTWGAERVAFFLLLRMLKFSDWPETFYGILSLTLWQSKMAMEQSL